MMNWLRVCFLIKGIAVSILKGIGRVIFSQGFFVIFIIMLTSIICFTVKDMENKKDNVQSIKKSETK
ncbi:hypothetical protein RC86_10880 [Pectobacterium brasiliense]|nr:hypothetical protein RC86_10880 [Pectobacterium brasiliense]